MDRTGPSIFDAAGMPKPAYDAVVATLELWITDVDVDLKPGAPGSRIDLGSRGVVPVAIPSSESFDLLQIDPETLALGPGAAGIAHRNGPHEEEMDGDGFLDAVSHYRTRETGVAFGETQACISGRTLDGAAFLGCDAMETLPAWGIDAGLP